MGLYFMVSFLDENACLSLLSSKESLADLQFWVTYFLSFRDLNVLVHCLLALNIDCNNSRTVDFFHLPFEGLNFITELTSS